MNNSPRLGVAICTFNAANEILDCLESLLASTGVSLSIVVADNASTDGTVALLQDWAAGRTVFIPPEDSPIDAAPVPRQGGVPLDGGEIIGLPHRVRLIQTGVNGGFAAGVNAALAALSAEPDLDRFWVLNPDSVVPSHTAHAFATHPAPQGGFALMGGRLNYYGEPDRIQIDGGTINRWTGITGNLNLYALHSQTPPPNPEQMDFISGASMVASRQFYEAAGPIPEEYFLYYEEIDWALKRETLPLLYCPEALVYHHAGTAIGSPRIGQIASPFSFFFKHRSRMRFMRRFFPMRVPTAMLYSLAKAGQLLMKGFGAEAGALLRGSFSLPPAQDIRNKLSPEARRRALKP